MFERLFSQNKFPLEIEKEYLKWIFEKRRKFIVWVAAVVSLFLLYFSVRDFGASANSSELLITLSLRAIELIFTACVVFLFLKVEPIPAQRLLLPCMLVITVAAVFDTYFWVKNINQDFNPTGQMFAVYVFMIIPYTSIVHKFVLGTVFVFGIFICGEYLNLASSVETVFYTLVIFVSEVAISYKIEALLRIQFKAIHDEKKQTAELRKREQELEKALKAEREAIKQNLNFIDMISHEYRTPLSIITSCVDSLETFELIKQSESASHTIKTIREASRRLLSIYGSSLHEKRINAAGLMPYKKQVDLLSIVELAADFVRSSYPAHTIFIDDEHCHTVMTIADNELLTTALINVLDNACKYSNPSRIDVCLIQEDLNCKVQISDKGFGIDSSELDAVFEKYYRSGMTNQKPGAGVGLYLVKKIVELHHGSIEIISEWNIGTTVMISIPLNKDDDE